MRRFAYNNAYAQRLKVITYGSYNLRIALVTCSVILARWLTQWVSLSRAVLQVPVQWYVSMSRARSRRSLVRRVLHVQHAFITRAIALAHELNKKSNSILALIIFFLDDHARATCPRLRGLTWLRPGIDTCKIHDGKIQEWRTVSVLQFSNVQSEKYLQSGVSHLRFEIKINFSSFF